MMRNYYFYSVIAVVTIVIVLTFTALVGNNLHTNAINSTVEYNSTSTICINDKPCVTTICINNDPCHTVTSNSTNTVHNLTNNNKNHPLVSPFPQESV